MDLNIRPFNAEVKQLYDNHGHFHDGDAGLDVYVINEQTIDPDEIPERYRELVRLNLDQDLITLKQIKFNNDIIHRSKVLKHFLANIKKKVKKIFG